MNWEIVLVLVGGIIYDNLGAEIQKFNQEWVSLNQLEGTINNRQKRDCAARCMCGVPNEKTRIIGGHPTRFVEYPWIVYIESHTDNGTFTCGGSIINDQYILTAAHCTIAEANRTFAVTKMDNINDVSNVMIMSIKQIIIHPGWNPSTNLSSDIALLKLNKPVKFDGSIGTDDYMAPLCVANDPAQTFDAANTSAIGWGRTVGNNFTSNSPQLLEVFIDVVNNTNCMRQFGKDRFNSTTMICAGTKDGRLGTCSGDSGGPLHSWTTASDGTLYHQVIGVVSFGGKLCGTHSVFARVPSFGTWITQNTADACECARPS